MNPVYGARLVVAAAFKDVKPRVEAAGFEVQVFGDSSSLVEAAPRLKLVRLYVLPVFMPTQDSFLTARELRTLSPWSQVWIASSQVPTQYWLDQDLCDRFVLLPLDVELIVTHLASVVV